ncbi:IS1595 family transposase [Ruegeria sp.]|uniref:IS1595 family transposase n=1 Tax=Ruegeria sp. TaxID=1879320 RepID=UPI003C7C3843
MTDYPKSLPEFQQRFPDDEACASWLFDLRWPNGFECPGCGHDKCWTLSCRSWTYECKGCRRQTSIRAGTLMHASNLPLTIWFWAAYLMATHSNGFSAVQLQKQLGLGSYRTAWLLLGKLRAAMIDPDRNPLSGLVEVDETSIRQRTGNGPVGVGRSHEGKLMIAGAVEIKGQGAKTHPGRLRLAVIADYTSETLHDFVATEIATGSSIKTDGLASYNNAPNMDHDRNVVGDQLAHLVLPWIHRVFSNFKAWALGVYHGLRAKHLQSYLDEFVFRFNRRRYRHAGLKTLLNLVTKRQPMTYKMLIGAEQSA